jgi:serine/threonine protein kinase
VSNNETLQPGMELGRYELLLPIAQGGMATVWAARLKGTRGFSKTVAVKTMLPALSDDPQFEQMFLDEARLASRIHHPNVCEILDLGEQDDFVYMVMEWVDGEALSVLGRASKKAETPIPVRVVLKIISQACLGLHAAHELKDDDGTPQQIVHRDVSPQNILVTYDGVSKVVDFGVAKAVGRSSGETTAGQLKGKIPYMSPEQARGGEIDRRTDIFAMGIVLYKMLTGVHPFSGDTDIVTMRNIISRPVLPPRVKNAALPRELDHLVVRCLQKEPDKRFSTMQEMSQALEQVLNSISGGTSMDDVGSFVRLLIGERGQKRRAAIRDAVRTLDERTSSMTVPAATVKPVVHEAVSEVMMTALKSGVGSQVLAASMRPSEVPTATPSGAEIPAALPPERKSKAGFIVGGVGIAAAAVILALFLTRTNRQQPGGPVAAGTSTPTGAAAPPPSATASAAPTDAPPAPSASASSEASLDLGSLPDSDKKDPKAVGKGPAKSGDAPATATANPKIPTLKPTAWVPSVQDPGF